MASRARAEGVVDRRVEAISERRRRSENESEKSRDRLKVDLQRRPQVDLESRRDIDHCLNYPVHGRTDDRNGDRTRHGETGERVVSSER